MEQAPPLAEHSVVRPRLHHSLHAGLERGSVIVSAPAGSGKTQLAVAWAGDQRVPRDIAWLALDEHDRDAATFVRHVLTAIETTGAGASAAARHPEPSIVDEGPLHALTEVLSAPSSDVVLILDDFHRVVGSATEDLLRRLMRYPADRTRLMVLGRVEPDLGQTRLRLLGQLTELVGRDLAFTPEEAEELFRCHGIDPSAVDVEAEHARSDGWAMALATRAATLAGTGAADVDSHLVDTYLMSEVFDVQPPEIQRFMLRASVTNPVCGELADALSDGSAGARTLAELQQAFVFLERLDARLDAQCTWYRWNPLFASALQSRLHEVDPSLQAQLRRIAGRWLGRRGYPLDAVCQSIAGQDVETATGVLAESWLDLVIDGDPSDVASLLELFPDADRSAHPELTLIDAFLAVTEGDLDRAVTSVDRAEQLSTALPWQQRQALRTTAMAVRLETAAKRGHDLGAELHRTAVSLALPPAGQTGRTLRRRRRALLLHQLGCYELSRWMRADSSEHLEEAVAEAAVVDVPCLVLRSRVLLAILDLDAGRLGHARAIALEALEAAESQGWHRHDNVGTAHTVLGALDLLRGEPDLALERLRRAAHAVQPVDRIARFRVRYLVQHAQRSRGQLTAARAEVDRISRMVQEWDAPAWVRVFAASATAQQLAAEGHPREALHHVAAAAGHAIDPEPNRHWRTTYAQVLLLNGRAAEARAALEPVVRMDGRGPVVVLALVVDALAAEGLGSHDDALLSLTRALRMAAPELVVEPFFMCGSPLRPLLEEVSGFGTPERPFVRELLDRLPPGGSEPWAGTAVEQLTARERQVLEALQGPLTNDEMASALFVALNTLRSHIKQINRKLGTTNRTDAVARALELGLIAPANDKAPGETWGFDARRARGGS